MNIDEVAQQVADGTEAMRQALCRRLAEEGEAGWQLLAILVSESGLPDDARLSVAEHLTEDMPVGLLEFATLRLLVETEPRLRGMGMISYRELYETREFSHQVSNVVPLRYLGLCSLAHDRGLECPVVSNYVPEWLVGRQPSLAT